MAHESLRVVDLVAKVARVTLKDTARVLMAFDAVVDFLEVPVDDLLATDFAVDKPSQENSEACNTAFAEFQEWLRRNGDDQWFQSLRSIR